MFVLLLYSALYHNNNIDLCIKSICSNSIWVDDSTATFELERPLNNTNNPRHTHDTDNMAEGRGSDRGYGVLVLTAALKFVIILTTITVIILVGVPYAEWWNIVLTYLFCAITLLYCIASVGVHLVTMQRSPENMGNAAVAETIILCVMLMGWILVCGSCADIALQTNEETGEPFGWASGVAGINIVLCLVLLLVYCGQIFMLHDALEPSPKHYATHQPQSYAAQQRYVVS